MPELVQTIMSMNRKEHNQRKFAASLKGIQLDDDAEEEKEKGSTFEDIQRRALGINASADDVVGITGNRIIIFSDIIVGDISTVA